MGVSPSKATKRDQRLKNNNPTARKKPATIKLAMPKKGRSKS